ncbi:MAG: 2TM domain-containing protein [Calothrix sp. C42_A2020_038]|nr:2TM domain-containing protein [Calothrix sp. C42_A2020_038]
MAPSDNQYIRSYTQEDIQQILQLAIARQANDQEKEFTYQQLLEIASELQISPDSLKQAESDWIVQQGEVQQRLAFDHYRQKRFRQRIGNYAIVNGFLLLVDFVGGWTISWALYPLLFSVLAIGLEGWNKFNKNTEEYELEFQRWSRKHLLKKSFNNLVNKFIKIVNG